MGAFLWIAALAVACLAYQAYVTMRVTANPNSTGVQQVLQIALIWFLPVVGALLVHGFLARRSRVGPSKTP
jgi:hypothetical protein